MIANIHVAFAPFNNKKVHYALTGGLAEEAAFFYFTLFAVYPQSRVHQAFAEPA